MTGDQRGTLYSVQGLRGLAAWAVVVHHAVQLGLVPGLTTGGLVFARTGLGVDVFFVISGFVMVAAAGGSAGRFLLRRAARIVPLYWLTTLVVALLIVAWPALLPGYGISPSFLLQSLLFIPAHNPGCTQFGCGLAVPVHTVGWTLEFEAMFYLVVAVALLLPRRQRWWFVAAAILALQHGKFGWYYANPIIYEFLVGVAAGLLWRRGLIPRAPFSALLALLGATLFVLPTAVYEIPVPSTPLFSLPVWAVPAFLLVYGCVGAERLFRQSAIVKRLGDHSYGVYLWHPPLLYLALWVGAPWWVALPACTAAIAALSSFSYRRFEVPVRRWIQRSEIKRVGTRRPDLEVVEGVA